MKASPFIFPDCYRTTPENLLRLKFFSIPPAAALKLFLLENKEAFKSIQRKTRGN